MSIIGWAITLIIILIVIILVLISVYYINRIIVLGNRIDNAWADIDVQLKKRADLVPNLVETVKGYAAHEKKVFENVTKARERMMSAGGVEERMKAGNQLAAALKTIFAIAENYPNLKASDNFKLLQEQLDGIESKIAYARQYYNESTLSFNNIIATIPGRWFAGTRVKRPYFEVTEEERAPVKVSF